MENGFTPHNHNTTKETLVLGIGNYLLGDEGVGCHVIRMLEAHTLPWGVGLLDGGTGGLHLLNQFDQYHHVILVDASMDSFSEGHIRFLKPRFASDFPPSLSAHDIGLKDLVEALQLLDSTPEITLIAISIKDLNRLSTDLSSTVEEAARETVQHILKMIGRDK